MASELAALKSALTANDLSKASSLLSALKVKLTTFASLPPLYEPSAHAADELALAREVLEQAVLLSVAQRDAAAFERHFAQLKPYYADARCVGRAAGRKRREGVPPAVPSPPRALTSPPPRSPLLPPSPAEHRLVGLNLLRLLVQNRTSEFHCELELLSAESLGSAHVHHAVALEQSLMEGAYNKVRERTVAGGRGQWSGFSHAPNSRTLRRCLRRARPCRPNTTRTSWTSWRTLCATTSQTAQPQLMRLSPSPLRSACSCSTLRPRRWGGCAATR